MTGAAGQQRVSPDFVANFVVPVPPIEEQHKIVRHVTTEAARFAEARNRLEQEIALLREYRTRLIAGSVTGKLDVRKAAACVPDEAGEAEPIDETDLIAGDDDEDDVDAVPEEADA